MKEENQKPKTISSAISSLQKKYGEGVVLKFKDTPSNIEAISTGCYSIDSLLGCGGLPRGRIIEAFGAQGGGKTSLCLFFAGQIQKQGGTVAFLDVENAYDKSYAGALGVDTQKLLVSQPSTLEETFDIVRAFSETNEIDLIIVDSVAAMTPKIELEGEEMLKDSVAVQARLMSKGLRILTGPVARSKTVVIFINQLRSNIGLYVGPKEITPGGKALKFFSSVRLQISSGEKILEKGVQIGNKMKIIAKKNKVGFPFKEAFLDLYYKTGVDLLNDIFEAAIEQNIISKQGNTYEFKKQKLGVGKEQTRQFLHENPEPYNNIKKELSKTLFK